MKSLVPALTPIILALVPRHTTASHALGNVTVSVVSNQTLSRIDEFSYTSPSPHNITHANPSQTTDELINSQLALQFDVCFPQIYCPIVANKEDVFKSRFDTHVCKQYCDHIRYHSVVQVLDVCDFSTSRNNGFDNGCVSFGLTMQASTRSEAQDIKQELGGYIVNSKQVWRDLLNELAPYFHPHVTNPDIVGYHIGRDMGETWYPAWDKGDELCSNDASVPFYMRLDPDEYLAPTMVDCCRKHYWWNVRGCAEPQNRPCPVGWVPTAEQNAREGIMNGQYYGSYPNIFYPGCKPATTPHYNNRSLKQEIKEDKEELAIRRELSHREQEHKLKALLERQKKLEKLMPPSSHRPPVHVPWKAQRLR